MRLQTISKVSKDYGISARMLRYYEQVGLIQSLRKNDYAYRVYDENTMNRLQQIIILRKLRIPVKHIVSILNNRDASRAVEIFQESISRIDGEITTLSTIKSILAGFVEEINKKVDVHLKLLTDDALLSVIGALSFSDNQIQESRESLSMEDLIKANEDLMKLEDRDVRIVYLPPMTVAAGFAVGEDCVDRASEIVNRFIRESGLLKLKPDARGFDFNFYKKTKGSSEKVHGHEAWVSIPHDMDIPAPLVKRTFNGGLFAAHVLREWDFQDWRRLKEWVDASDKYDSDWGSPRWESAETGYGYGLEETLNLYNFIENHDAEMSWLQLDLLFPIKEKIQGEC
jgi:DNA-binding transcriptional MerR regulator